MRALVALAPAALLLAAAGCHAADPCAGKPAVCVTVEATGSGGAALDEIRVSVTTASGGTALTGSSGAVTPRATLPVQFAALLRADAIGLLSFALDGVRDGQIVSHGAAQVTVPASGHARVEVAMVASAPGDGGSGAVVLTPDPQSLNMVPIGGHATAMFTATNTGSSAVQVGGISVAPADGDFSVDGATTCAGGAQLGPQQTCVVAIAFAPTGDRLTTVTVQLGYSGGVATATLHAATSGWVDESIAGAPVAFSFVWAIDAGHVYAVGQPNVVYYRSASGWSARTGPAASGDNVTSVWAPSNNDLYTVAQSTLVYHSTDQGASWSSTDSMITGKALSIVGTDANNVYASGSMGSIVHGSNAALWGIDRAPTTVAVPFVMQAGGVLLAVSTDQVINRVGANNWTVLFDAAGAATFSAVWGTTTGDLYAVGKKSGCTPPNDCGVIYHFVAGNTPVVRSVPGCDGFNMVLGMLSGGTRLYAVGQGGTIATSTGGDVWTAMSVGAQTLTGVDRVDSAGSEIYVVGAAGSIFHLTQ
jgi:hypothetical protein